ncbi:MAG: nucleotidyltransferase [Planctomycetes bacterium GWF2_41_51]|nr:MAG: nucleotidyltransferase [Planctomycetes bacterium GWF2_41_51]HBG27006.1 nucleotidyltransferase [Phycisphaerales bacterium]
MTDLTQTLKVNRNKILELASRYGAKNVRIFGSAARADFDQYSDIDFLVDMEKGRSLLDMGGLLMELQNLLGCNVDVVTPQGLRPRIRETILKEAMAL